MLNDDELRIRNVVRFDADLRTLSERPNLLDVVEEFASERVVCSGLNFESFLHSRLSNARSGYSPQKRSARSVQPISASGQSLSQQLAQIHWNELGARNSLDDGSQVARSEVLREFFSADLVRHFAPPLSLIFASHRDAYKSSASSINALAALFGCSIDAVIPIARRMTDDVARAQRELRDRVCPKTGTVLESLVNCLEVFPLVNCDQLLISTGANKSNVYRAIYLLEEVGAIVEVSGRKKHQMWIAPEVVKIVNESFKRASRVAIS